MKFLQRNFLMICLATGLGLRLAIAPLGAHPGDFATFSRWAEVIYNSGLMSIYTGSDANYPPFALALIGVSRWVYGLFWSGQAAGPGWLVIAKLPPILCDTGIALLAARRITNSSTSLWLLWAAGVVFNPAMIYLSAWWGQLESVYMLGVLAACYAILDQRWFRAGLWLGAALMVKVQAAVILPAIIVVLLRENQSQTIVRHGLRLAMGLIAIVSITLLPFIMTDQGTLVWLRIIALVSSPSWLTVNALNFWYLVTGGSGNWAFNAPMLITDADLLVAGLSSGQIGAALLAVWTMIVVVILWKRYRNDPHLMLVGAALLYLGVFLWPTQAHERYAFGAVILLWGWVLISPARRGDLLLVGAVTLLHWLNLMWAAPFAEWLDTLFAGNIAVGMAISALMLVAAGLWLWRFSRALPPPI